MRWKINHQRCVVENTNISILNVQVKTNFNQSDDKSNFKRKESVKQRYTIVNASI